VAYLILKRGGCSDIEIKGAKRKKLKPLKEFNKKNEVPAGPLSSSKKEWMPKHIISASN
jgi:hypothetical protein